MRTTNRRRWATIGGVAAVSVVLAACSGGSGASGSAPTPSQSAQARPSSTAKLSIVDPKNGETVRGSSVELKVSLTGAQIVSATSTHIVPDRGHLHVYLDNQIVSMTFGADQRIPSVKSGQHVLKVEFVASDHLPFDPRVISSIVFTVAR